MLTICRASLPSHAGKAEVGGAVQAVSGHLFGGINRLDERIPARAR
ncbi:MAG: hypothetical protein ACXQTG_00230 [Methanoculleaceae archaeon]